MAHNVLEKMVYSYKQPMWHGLTQPSMEEMTAIEVLDKFAQLVIAEHEKEDK